MLKTSSVRLKTSSVNISKKGSSVCTEGACRFGSADHRGADWAERRLFGPIDAFREMTVCLGRKSAAILSYHLSRRIEKSKPVFNIVRGSPGEKSLLDLLPMGAVRLRRLYQGLNLFVFSSIRSRLWDRLQPRLPFYCLHTSIADHSLRSRAGFSEWFHLFAHSRVGISGRSSCDAARAGGRNLTYGLRSDSRPLVRRLSICVSDQNLRQTMCASRCR